MASGTFTIKSSGGDYTSLAAWWAGEAADFTGTGPCKAECYALGAAAGGVTINGATTTAADYVEIYTPTSERHSGKWRTDKHYIEAANGSGVITINEDYVRLNGLQVRNTNIGTAGQCAVRVLSTGNTVDIRVYDSILRGGYDNVRITTGETTAYFWNVIAYGNGNAAIYSTRSIKVYSCTLIGAAYGIYRSGTVTITAKNCYAKGTTAAYSAGVALTTCASADATGSAGLQNIAYDATNFTDVGAGTEDLHLAADSALVGVGTNTSGEAAPMNFTTDIDGDDRGLTWSVGADQPAAPSASLGALMIAGAVTNTTAKILVRTNGTSYPVKIEYKTTAQTWAQATMTGEVTTDTDFDWCAVFELTGLDASTIYDYRAYVNGSISITDGKFKTFPAAGAQAVTTFGIGSCMRNSFRPYTILDDIVTKNPDFFLMIGDNLYTDGSTTYANYKNNYYSGDTTGDNGTWNESSFKIFAKKFAHFFSIDDHEISNDWASGKTGKYPDAMKAYHIYQHSHNPTGGDSISGVCETGTATTNVKDTGAFADADVGDVIYNTTQRKITHITALVDADNVTINDTGFFAVGDSYIIPRFYYSFVCGDMEFFMIDDVAYRSALGATDDASKTMLGSRQKTWLKATIVNSTASWKFLISGAPFTGPGNAGWGWGNYTTERQELLDYFDTNGVTGLVVLTGDRHSVRAWQLQGSTPAKPFTYSWVYEFMASPLANSHFGSDESDTADRMFLYSTDDYYILITSDTTQPDPSLKIEVYASGETQPKNVSFLYLSKANDNLAAGGGGGVNSAWGSIH